MAKDSDKPKSRKLPQKKAPFHRATPSQNVVFLDNGVVNHRASLTRQLPAHIGSSAPPVTAENVVPNAGAHAIGRRNQISGFPTSYLRSTFNSASPFVHNAPSFSSDASSRAEETFEAYIQPASAASSAIPEPTVFSWHLEDKEHVALGYERLKVGRKAARVQGRRDTPIQGHPPALTPAAGSVDQCGVFSTHDSASTAAVAADAAHTRVLRKRPTQPATTGASQGHSGTHAAGASRQKRKTEASTDENAPSSKKRGSRTQVSSPATISHAESAQPNMELSVDDAFGKPTAASQLLKRKRPSHTLGRVESRANAGAPEPEIQSTTEDVDMCVVDPGAAQDAVHAPVAPHTPSVSAAETPSSPQRASKKRSKRTRVKAKPARESAGRPDEQTALVTGGQERGPLSAEDGLNDNLEPGDTDCEGKDRKRPRHEDDREQLQESAGPVYETPQEEAEVDLDAELVPGTETPKESCTTTQGSQLANDGGTSRGSHLEVISEPLVDRRPAEPAEDLADVVAAGYSSPEDGDASEVRAPSGSEGVGCDYPQTASTSEEPKLSTDSLSGSIQDIRRASTPPVYVDPSGKGDDLLANENPPADLACARPLTPVFQDTGCASAASPSNVSGPTLQRSDIESDDGAVDFGMEAALDVMLSGGQLTEAQLAALTPHIIGASSEWDLSAADAAALDLEAHIPDLALGDWDMEELLRDSAGCMLGLEDYLAHSAAHTTTPADLSEAIPTLDALGLDVLGLAEHLLPLVDFEAPAGDSDAVAALGLDLNFDLAHPSLDVSEGALNVSIGDCEAALPGGGGFGFGRLGLVAVDPTMFDSHTEEALPELGLNSRETCFPVGIGRPDSIEASTRTTVPAGYDDDPFPQEGREAISQRSPLSVDADATSLSAVSISPSGPSQLHARGGHFLSAFTPVAYDTLAGSMLLGSTTEVESGSLSTERPSLGTDVLGRSLSRSTTPSNISVPDTASPAPSAAGSSAPTVQHFLSPPHPMAPRIQPIALPPPSIVQTNRAVSPQPIVAPSLDPGSIASPGASVPNLPTDVAPLAEVAWSTMFRQLKQTKKATPVRRRIGVLRRYEEGREDWHDDTGEVRLEDTIVEKDNAQAPSQGGPSGTAAGLSETEERGGERTEGPEVIVIEDSEDEESEIRKDPHKCPICARRFKLPNGLAIHLKWHYGESSLDWRRGVGRNGRILERAKEAKEIAAIRTRELAEAQSAASSTLDAASVTTAEPDPSSDKCVSPTTLQTSIDAAAASSGPFVMPFAPVGLPDDPFDFLVTRQHDDGRKSSDINGAAPPPPVHAASIDIDVGFGAREQSEPQSTPELSPGPSRCDDEAVRLSDQHPEPSWSDDLFGSEADPSEIELDECMSLAIQVETAATITSDACLCEGKLHDSGRGLELGLSPLTGFASLQLLH